MTPTLEEHAEAICAKYCGLIHLGDGLRPHQESEPCPLRDAIASAIREAVEAEREACAKVADGGAISWKSNRESQQDNLRGADRADARESEAKRIAAAIRARGKKQ
jgi:hypothetical protein